MLQDLRGSNAYG
ncbi:hypothetical protein D030_4032A, partial [Vibrio parahaemolyticus AQ3810]